MLADAKGCCQSGSTAEDEDADEAICAQGTLPNPGRCG